tara:strand:- start:132 stop:974 length:843 start_codon:yes stop_codon:yes gene_type:complete
MIIQDSIMLAAKTLRKNNIKSPILDSELLLSEVIKKDRKYIIFNSKKKLSKKSVIDFKRLVERRKRGEPVAYLTNYKEFWKQKYYVNQNVLIPRPDTEVLIEETLKIYQSDKKLNFLDIGTGSGCLLLSILHERKNFTGYGIDISKKAINSAKFNAKLQHLSNRAKFYNSDIDKFFIGKYDLIISNPPYIKNSDLKYLDKDISCFEPKVALDGGCDGFAKITKVISRASNLIKKSGKFILEIGCHQRYKTIKKLEDNNFFINKIIKDYGNNDRCIVSTKI